jgi:hypothetical protein
MIKLFIIPAVLLATAVLSFGQGIVSFANTSQTRISTNRFYSPVGVAMGADPVGTWYYALFRGPSTMNSINTNVDPTSVGWTVVAIGTNTALAGRLSGNTTSEGVVVTAVAPSVNDYAVAGWSASIGTSWSDVQAFFGNQPVFTPEMHFDLSFYDGYYGISQTIANDVVAAPTGSIAISSIFSTSGVTGFKLSGYFFADLVPEPGAFTLLGLGVAGLVLFRRRKLSRNHEIE